MYEVFVMEVDYGKCLHCGGCAGSCPMNTIYLADYILEFGDKCNKCGRCIKVCPVGALSEGN